MANGKRKPRGARRLNILVLAVGKASGPEAELCERYRDRAAKAGNHMGISRVTVREVSEQQGPSRAALEGPSLLSKRPQGVLVALDERGTDWTSKAFARCFQGWLDHGAANLTFMLGGADGHSALVRDAADEVWALGKITLPHLLARAVLMEQIYRSITICTGHPYHRA